MVTTRMVTGACSVYRSHRRCRRRRRRRCRRRRRRRRRAGISQQGGRRHLAIASALVWARRAMRPQSTRPRLRAIAQPSTPCSAPTVILKLQAPVFSAARRTPQTHIAFQAWRGDPTCTITPASLWGGSTVILCRPRVRTRRSAPVGRSTGSGGSETPTFILYLAITN